MTLDEFAEVARRVYVDVASNEFKLEGRKQTISRISMLTGIQRKEVSRLQKLSIFEQTELDSSYNRGVRITSGWRHDRRFSTRAGKAKALSLEGENSFAELVRRFSGDLPYRAVLDEFLRVGVVEVRNDKVVLKNPAGYVPSESDEIQINILGQATADLIGTIHHNVTSQDDTRLQLTVAYNNLSPRVAALFKQKSQAEGWDLIKAFDTWLSKHDRDNNPKKIVEEKEEGRVRAGVGIYFFQEPFEEERNGE